MTEGIARETYTSGSGVNYILRHERDDRGDYWTGGSGDGKWVWGWQSRFDSRDRAIQHISDLERVEAASALPADTREAYEAACAATGINPKTDAEIHDMAYALTYFNISITEHGVDLVIETKLARKRLQALATGVPVAKTPAQELRQSAAAARRRALIEQAKTTGKPVALATWQEECNDPREECSVDSITEWAMPNGTVETTRDHNW